jgi:hypothetical protein
MEIETILKQRGRDSEDQIIFSESILKTKEFTALIEKSYVANISYSAIFLVRYQFGNMRLTDIIDIVKKYEPVGTNFHIETSNPFIAIYYDFQMRTGIN